VAANGDPRTEPESTAGQNLKNCNGGSPTRKGIGLDNTSNTDTRPMEHGAFVKQGKADGGAIVENQIIVTFAKGAGSLATSTPRDDRVTSG